MPKLEETILLATEAHQGQVDKAGQPYILHPLRLMMTMPDETSQIVALLHDVVEDTPITFDDLRQRGYSETIISALDCLTRREDETYQQFVERAKANPIARRVKLADIEDNMDVRRLKSISEKDLERLQRYRDAWQFLREVL